MRVGAIDCGTNAIRLLVADGRVDGQGRTRLVDVVRRMEIVRLGHGIDRTGVISPSAMARTLIAAADYADQCRSLGVEAVRFVATSASRDAGNADEFVAGVRHAFGDIDVAPEVITGRAEAALSFRGATGDLRAGGFSGPYLVVDLGGGSTELVRGTDTVDASCSIDVGCVRISERHLAGDPPTPAEITAAATDVAAALTAGVGAVGLAGIETVVGLAGSITTITAHALGLTAYQPSAIHLAPLTVAQHLAASAELLAMPRAERAALGFMHPGRVDVIGAGALVWMEVLGLVSRASPQATVITSEHDILDGIALSLVR